MCGIAGKYNIRNNESVSPDLIEKMCSSMAYRGPDDAGVYVDGPVGLGHRRLSIIDLSPLGHQPMGTSDGSLWITFNGEIYNFLELRKNLIEKGYTFKSNSDTEVLLYLYREYGEQCLRHLRGMFAFAIWDKKGQTLFLARDRIGKKPLFYYFDGKTLLFASEIKAILEDSIVKREINFEAFNDYFKYLYVPDPKTIYNNIHKLKPGHYMTCSSEGIAVKEYWDVSFSSVSDRSLDETCETLLDVLDESVRLRMISDVPLGAFLSGGIDSSGVVALMAHNNDKPITTCSIGFDSKTFDEIAFARTVAEKFKTDHHEFTVKENAEAVINDLAYYFDEPFADSSAVPTYYVSKLARQKVTVALSGDGGDENFAGYEKYFLDDVENRIRSKVPGLIRRRIAPILGGLLSGMDQTLFKRAATLCHTLAHEPDYGFYLTNTEFDDRIWQRSVRDEIKKKINGYDPYSVTRHYYHKADTESHLSRILYVDLKTYLPGDILVKVDRMSMANSLEVRAPILDHNIIELAAAIRPDLKYNRGDKKYVLKQSFKKILPPEIMYRKKMGFSVPLANWMRGELRELAESALFDKNAGLSHFFKMPVVREIWDRHQSGKMNHAAILWALLMFELWFRRFMK